MRISYKNLFVVLLAGISLFFVIFTLLKSGPVPNSTATSGTTVKMENGKQIAEVTVTSGGYFPKEVTLKSGTPATLRMVSKSAYGCATAFTIPQLKYSEWLPLNGNTDIDLGNQPNGASILGTCSMGMYSVKINFN